MAGGTQIRKTEKQLVKKEIEASFNNNSKIEIVILISLFYLLCLIIKSSFACALSLVKQATYHGQNKYQNVRDFEMVYNVIWIR